MNLITDSGDERLTSDMILNGLVPGDLVTESLRAALAAKEKAEGALCRAREATMQDYADEDDAVSHIQGALSTSSPCPHEEEAKRLREDNENLLWNLAGCSAYAGGYGVEEGHDIGAARPALNEVREMALREKQLRAIADCAKKVDRENYFGEGDSDSDAEQELHVALRRADAGREGK